MEYVGKLGSLFTSVHNFYNEINPATLSGAIDIVVVEQEDGDLACSPFHVRFGKLSVLMPQEKRVQIKVNGQVVPYVMKVGEAGEAFFVFETEHEVPEEFQTSPIMEAVSEEKSDEEPPYLDLGESKDLNKVEQTDTFEDEERQKIKLPLPAELQSPKMIIDEQMDKVVTKLDPYHKHDSDPTQLEDPVLAEAIDTLKTPTIESNLLEDGSTLLERVIPEAITTTTVAKERFVVRPAHGDIYSTWMDVTHAAVPNDEVPEKEEEHGKGDESIVLDIAGYKTGGEVEDDQDVTEELLKEEMDKLLLQDPQHPDLVQSPPSLSPTLQPVDFNTGKEEEFTTGEQEITEEPETVKEEEEPKRSLWGWGSRRQATNDAFDSTPTSPVMNQGLNMLPGTTYRIEMSLCGFSAFGKDEKENASVFNQHISTYDNFTHNPNMLNDKRLVFRYNNRYYAAGHAGPLFTSLLIYKKPLEDEDIVSDSRESYQFGKGWRQWLSRSSVAAPEPVQTKDEETTFTTTTTTTSVGWSADHVHPEQAESPSLPRKVYAKTLRLTSDQLKSLNLNKGVNTVSFSVSSAYQGTATCAAKIFYWDHGISVVISDIDGTITKSDTLGHVFTMIGKDWTHMGVAKLYTDIANNGYHFLYLTSRAIGQADYTRDYLKKVVQDKYQLPNGPVIMSPDRLFTSLHREVVLRKPEVFKMACLRDVQRLFGGRDPFYAGFGNRITDARSYRSVNVPTSRIFTIDPYGDLKLELLMGFKSSYIHLNDLVDQIFPPINKVTNEEYNDWNFWKSPMADIDIPELEIPLEPTSPKPKPIKPDPSALPASSVVAAANTSRGLLRSFTSRSDTSPPASRKPTSSNSTPNLLKKELANEDQVTSDQKTLATADNDSAPGVLNKISSGVRSTLSRTFLSSSESGMSTPTSLPDTPVVEEKAEVNTGNHDVKEQDVDSLLDDIDMDDIPFI